MASQIKSVSEEIMSYQMLTSDHRNTEISVPSLNLVDVDEFFNSLIIKSFFQKMAIQDLHS